MLVYALGKYYRPDLNFPYSLPRRSNGIKDFENDPPLSSCGIFQSRMAGMFGEICNNHSNDYRSGILSPGYPPAEVSISIIPALLIMLRHREVK